MRWFFFAFLIQSERVRAGSWLGATLALVAMGIIGVLIKLIEVYGLMLWFGSFCWPHYLGFAIPSMILLLAHPPASVMTRSAMHRKLQPPPAKVVA